MPELIRLSCWTAMNRTVTIQPQDGMQNGSILMVSMPVNILRQFWTINLPSSTSTTLTGLRNSFKEHISIKEALLNNYIVNILTELLIGRGTEHSVNISASIIEDTVAYINEHLADPLTLEKLASQASLSPFYFSRLFKKETGFTPHGYVITARVNNAKFLLKSSNSTIKEICFKTGFTSESSFCTTFKKVTGSTPSEYREHICQ